MKLREWVGGWVGGGQGRAAKRASEQAAACRKRAGELDFRACERARRRAGPAGGLAGNRGWCSDVAADVRAYSHEGACIGKRALACAHWHESAHKRSWDRNHRLHL